ncbi:OmpA family protein [Dactylosporangium sp. NPDC006015]|uniref:OmpA family protein n=1 Tax=Dactylosporangium sp. NPDC006015 TaxID=3154576 RepID=UPI0033A777C1
MAGTTTTRTVRHELRRVNPVVPIVVGVVGLAALAAGMEVPFRHHVENVLTDHTKVALSNAGIDAQVSFTGRDGTVRVGSADEKQQAEDVSRAVEGVRVVTVIAPPKVEVPPSPVAVKLLVDAGKATLTGTVADDAAKSALADAVKTAFGSENVLDEVTVDAKRSTDGVKIAALAPVLVALGKETKAGVVDLQGGTVTLTGTVVSQAVKAQAEQAAREVTGIVRNELAIGEAKAEQVQTQLVALPTVEFENDKATLTQQGQAVVANVASILKANPSIRISIEGHTDSTGTEARNQTLSEARAKTVLDTLVALGIAPERLTSKGFGESRPKVPDTSDAAKAINRRVEFIVQQ